MNLYGTYLWLALVCIDNGYPENISMYSGIDRDTHLVFLSDMVETRQGTVENFLTFIYAQHNGRTQPIIRRLK
jgi:hypothetical protein